MTAFADHLLLAVITLPALAPIVALIQLLFPGLLGDHWRHYRAAISVMLSQSSLYFLQWALLTWYFTTPVWWLSDRSLSWGGVIVATLGYLGAVFIRPGAQQTAPVRVEFLAFAGLTGACALWLAIQIRWGASWLDPLLVLVAASTVTLLHLCLRWSWAANGKSVKVPSEVLFLLVMMIGSAGLTAYVYQDSAAEGGRLSINGGATTARLNAQRTGSAAVDDSGPTTPQLLWTFDPAPKRGQVFLDSSPTVVDGVVFVGGYTEVLAYRQGVIYAINGRKGSAGELLWRYEDSALRPVFSSASVAGARLFVGEGYHQDSNCRLLSFNAERGGEPLATFKTTSHVESTPTVDGTRLYVGAGDDGVYALDTARGSFQVAWHRPGIHVDASPLVADGRVFAGGVVGDLVADLQVLAIDAQTGDVAWSVKTELPVPAPLAYHDGSVFAPLGNGKLNKEAEHPAGGIWKLDAATGDKQWEFATSGSVLSSPVVSAERVYFVVRSGECFCLDAKSGERVWRSPLGEPLVSAPIVSGGRMFVLSARGRLHCLDAATGESLWQFDELERPAADVYSSPLLVAGRLYVCVGGKVHCVGDKGAK